MKMVHDDWQYLVVYEKHPYAVFQGYKTNIKFQEKIQVSWFHAEFCFATIWVPKQTEINK